MQKLHEHVMPVEPTTRRIPKRAWLTLCFQGFLVMSALGLIVLAAFLRATPYWDADLQLTRAVQAFNPAWFDGLMRLVGQPGYPPQVYLVVVLVLFILYKAGLKWEALMELFATIGIGVVGYIFKILVDRPRPTPDLVYVATSLDGGQLSFPAGHVQSYVAIFGFLWYLSYSLLPKHSWIRFVNLVGYGVMIALIGLSRVYLGEHWPTDVVGGYFLGSLWLALTLHIYRCYRPRRFAAEPAPKAKAR